MIMISRKSGLRLNRIKR